MASSLGPKFRVYRVYGSDVNYDRSHLHMAAYDSTSNISIRFLFN